MTDREPFTGDWRIDIGVSEFSTPSPLSWTLRVFAHPAGMTVEEHLRQATGAGLHVTFSAEFDGRDYSVHGSPIMDSISFVRRSERMLEATAKRGGVISMRDTTEVSEDGSTLTVTYVVLAGDQSVARGRAVFRRE